MNDIMPRTRDSAPRGMALRKAMPYPVKLAFRQARATAQTLAAFLYDARRFRRHSGAFNPHRDPAARLANITKYYHTIEKGLALPAPRPGFGQQMNRDLCEKIRAEIAAGTTGPEIEYAVDAIAGYQAFNERSGVESPPWIGETLAFARAHGIAGAGHPVRAPLPRTPIAADDALAFITSRHSVRHYAPGDVGDDMLAAAARAAQSAPCVCNRQASKVYFIRDRDAKARALACQNGNRGFGDAAPIIGLVTVDLRSFLDPSERYQAYIDGGLFTMNLLLGLHAQGLGACCLNWSALPAQDRGFRRLGLIPDHETIITMIAIGRLRDDAYVVARSERHETGQVMTIV